MTTLDDKTVDTRRSLRRTAVRLAEQYGYAGTTVELIAATAQLSPGNLRSTFATKEDIFLKLPMTTGLAGYLDRIAAHPDQPVGAVVVDATRARFSGPGDVGHPEVARHIRLIAATPGLTDALWQRSTTWTDTLHRRLGPGLATRGRARAIVSVIIEGALDWGQHADTPSIDALLARLDEASSRLG